MGTKGKSLTREDKVLTPPLAAAWIGTSVWTLQMFCSQIVWSLPGYHQSAIPGFTTICPVWFSLALSLPFFAFANSSSAIAKESLERETSRSRSRLSRAYTRQFFSPYSFFFFLSGSELSCGGENSMACMAALVGASVAIGAPSAALSRSSASSVICSSSSSFNPVFLRNRSFHGTTVRLGATKPGLTFSSFVILCWEPSVQMMMMAFSSIILSMIAYCILRCSLVSNVPPPFPKFRIPWMF